MQQEAREIPIIEVTDDIGQALAKGMVHHFIDKIEVAEGLIDDEAAEGTEDKYEIRSKLAVNGQIIDFPTASLQGVEPADKAGHFLMHFYQNIETRTKVISILVIGTTIVTCGGLIYKHEK